MDGQAISFGPFRLLAEQRLLLEDDQPVRLGSRAFDILAMLVERAGEVVGKDELISRTWPKTFVEDANLKIQVSALRRALGDGQSGRRYIATIPGRGYNFVAAVRSERPPQAPLPATIALAAAHNLPLAATRMIGREEAVATLVARVSRERLLTIVGPGGIGKTTVALAVAECVISDYEHGVWLADLAPLGDPRLVPSTVATVLGLEIRTENPLPGLIAALRDRRMLLLLDNCEHVIDAAAGLAVGVLTGAPGVSILATSREPLGVVGEREHRLGPLGNPPSSTGLTAAEAAAFPAVQLFVERVTAIVEDFALTDANAPLIVEICQRLDGLPLAIEFAAPRIEVLGIEGLAARLDHSLPLSGTRRRATTPRHRTMRAVVDWSYGLLSGDEQRFLRALGTFAGGFTVEAAAAVALDPATPRIEAIDGLADLVAKSLVVADVNGAIPRFRLLDTTRAYAIEKLNESGERQRLERRRAEYYRNLFELAEAASEMRPEDEWLADYAREIDNLRGALDWAFAPGGDGSIGVALTAAAVPLWTRLSLLAECRGRVERALARLDLTGERGLRHEMRLRAALGMSLNYTTGPISATEAAWANTLKIAKTLDDNEFQLRALRGLWAHHMNAGEYRRALEFGQDFRKLAETSTDPADLDFGDRMVALMLHYLGDQRSARGALERRLALAHPPVSRRRSQTARFLLDQDVTVQALLSRILWLQGFANQATRTAQVAVNKAAAIGHALSLCHALAQAACPVALYTGDLAAAEGFVATLLDVARDLGLAGWIARSHCFQGMVAIMRDDYAVGLPQLRGGLDELREVGAAPSTAAFLAVHACGLGRAGRVSEGMAAIDEALMLSKRYEERWCLPELLRNKGELLLLQGAPGATVGEDHFRQALDVARQQEALSWELRAATGLARLLRDQRRPAQALETLRPVYDRFIEGFGTIDLIAAKYLLEELSDGGRD
jgi:predicted ATPase/DNA-binding winged helix-turn-helix (wHTH) protein